MPHFFPQRLVVKQFGDGLAQSIDIQRFHKQSIFPMLDEIQKCDVVIGSRFLTGGGEKGRHPARKFITHLANLYIRIILGIKVKDATSGYRLFKREVLENINLDNLNARGPEVVQEILYAVARKGCKIEEIPIIFQERKAGQSTFSAKIMLNSLLKIPLMRLKKAK